MSSYSDSRINICGEIDRIEYFGGDSVEKREE